MSRVLSVTVVSLAMFAALGIRVSGDDTPWLDLRLLRHVPPRKEPDRLSRLCEAFVGAGIVFGVILVLAAFLWLIVERKWRPAFFWCTTFAGVAALDLALKPIFERPAINDSTDKYSFPSGNAMASMALLVAAGTLVSSGRARRLILIVGGGIVLAYGGALVYLSWHFPTDVLAGWLLSLAWVSFLGLTIRPNGVLPPVGQAHALAPPMVGRD